MLNNIKSVMLGHAVGDALGVPAEFCLREELEQNPYSIKEVYEQNKHINLIDIVDSWVEENWEDVLDEHEVDTIYDFIEIGGVLGKEYLNGGKVESFGDLQRLVLSNVINQIKVNL